MATGIVSLVAAVCIEFVSVTLCNNYGGLVTRHVSVVLELCTALVSATEENK